MSALRTLSELSGNGVHLRIEGSGLALSAPKGILTEGLVSKLRKQKPALLRSLLDIRDKAGDDWQEITNDPSQFKAFTELLMVVAMREQGVCPDHYTATTECKHCGIVPIFEDCPPKVGACVWCMSGLTAPTIPRD